MDSKALLQVKEDNLVCHSPVWFVTFTTSEKVSKAIELCLKLQKHCKIFNSQENRIKTKMNFLNY